MESLVIGKSLGRSVSLPSPMSLQEYESVFKNWMAKILIVGKKVFIEYPETMVLGDKLSYGFQWLPFLKIWHKDCSMEIIIKVLFLRKRAKYEKLCNWVDFGFWDFDCFGVCLRWLGEIPPVTSPLTVKSSVKKGPRLLKLSLSRLPLSFGVTTLSLVIIDSDEHAVVRTCRWKPCPRQSILPDGLFQNSHSYSPLESFIGNRELQSGYLMPNLEMKQTGCPCPSIKETCYFQRGFCRLRSKVNLGVWMELLQH